MDNKKSARSDPASSHKSEAGIVLVMGATGYIGGRLVSALMESGYQVRAMVRTPSPEYEDRWPGAQVVVADVLDQSALEAAFDGVSAVYFLIHPFATIPLSSDDTSVRMAETVGTVAYRAGIKNIIYLGTLGSSKHTRSREKVITTLRRGKVPVTVLRTSIIIGAGSAWYEVIQYLVRNLPIVFIPLWARNRFQPIAISDVLRYLAGVLETPQMTGLSFDIGGKDVLSYETMMKHLAELLGKRRLFVSSPISTTQIFSYLGSLITPVPGPIVIKMMQSLGADMVCHEQRIRTFLPFEPLSYREAVARALSGEERDEVPTRWSDAYPPAHELAVKLHDLGKKPAFRARYSIGTDKPASALYSIICRVGGHVGWLHSTWLWRLRGLIDRLFFGVGTARGRRSRSSLKVNDVIDFWRVEALDQDRRLLLRAEMRMPGKAWLEFRILEGHTLNRIIITAYYKPNGFLGKVYWYFFLPFHHYIFNNLLKEIEDQSETAPQSKTALERDPTATTTASGSRSASRGQI